MDKLEYLKSVIAKTGYPLEIQISSQLDNCWSNVTNTDSYFDREEQKLRDVDIVISSKYIEKEYDVTLQTGMVIECKKTKNYAWVFFTRPFKFTPVEADGQYLDSLQCLTKNLEKNMFLHDLLNFTKSLHYKNFNRVSVAYSEFILDSKDQSQRNSKNCHHEIFEAQNQVKKYLDCQFEQFMDYSNQTESISTNFFFHCIVFDGDLYEAVVTQDILEIKETEHLLLSTTYKSPYAIFERIVLIDVVKKEYFDKYVAQILKDRMDLEHTFKCVIANQLKIRVEDLKEYLPHGSKKAT
jgi:hypothetical protein